ncbi:MAG: hypothetical protein CMC55_00210 [Flavobacteriaceae bacterium]|jgi:hypothetical protein|nr:hypothetical protein [Flavobacteriaceae bacterium]|tara:strand:+ start:2219 stop:3061 length:843 start_codon:yes stop_codon:yes gene_type:complete
MTFPISLKEMNPEAIYRPLLNRCWRVAAHSSSIQEALEHLQQASITNPQFIEIKIMISGLRACLGNSKEFTSFLNSTKANHPLVQSFKWVLSLPKLPKILFNRWQSLKEGIRLADTSRPFYEFGVWKGESFKYLIENGFTRGFGFDTFTGLPEPWHTIQPKGGLSANGQIPNISKGKFIVGEFKDTLPKFFSQQRPLAGLINFDADLYSSTLCALNYSKEIIDERTILVFDEFIEVLNRNWKLDEYQALTEFCKKYKMKYTVLTISFFDLQAIIKLEKVI